MIMEEIHAIERVPTEELKGNLRLILNKTNQISDTYLILVLP